jgi:hypothetical protein
MIDHNTNQCTFPSLLKYVPKTVDPTFLPLMLVWSPQFFYSNR